MTEMTEPTEPTEPGGNTDLSGAEEPVESITDESALREAFENTLEISQDVEPTESAASEATDSREKVEEEDRQQDGARDGETDRQQDGETDGQTVHPPAAESSSTESKWAVGARCRAVWSEDGRVYPATVVSLDGERCRVRFNGYGNQEDVELSSLKSPDAAAPQTQRQNSTEWRPGSRCRAVYSEDSLVYPAVILWVKGQRCCIRFDDYNNEEEQDVGNLLHLDELHGPSRATAAKGSNWKSSGTSSNLDWKRRREENQGERGGGGGRRREENQGDRGGGERRSARRDEEQNSSWVKEKASNQSKVEKEAEEKKRGDQQAEKPTNHSFSFFPPFPPPPRQSSSEDPVSFISPPPPLCSFAGSSAGVDSSSSMLMLWYMCGFHTGSYMAQQGFKSNSKD
ncbi:uncharacterized protein LOC141767312 isoform X2 [Sebastes fasciatus]|uniref:uncharacterized protein LOC141767312 isoform X2 n=1 Tax=Sebastes fasciatus TaxID=394691 RepID=UPI003D9DCCCD